MPSLLQNISAQWDLWTGRYYAFFAKTEEDIQGCVDVLEAVRRQELNRVSGKSVLDSHSFGAHNLDYRLVACKDKKTGQIIGCMRLTNALHTKPIQASREEYQLDLFQDDMLNKLSIFTRLVVLKHYRKSPAAVVIVGYSFASILEEGGLGMLMSCEPNLFSLYQRLGCRPIGPLHNSPSGGYRVPMIGIADRDYFVECGSPALPLFKHVDWDKFAFMRKWYHDLVEEKGGINVGVEFYKASKEADDEAVHAILTDGLSEKGKKAFLKNAMTIQCKEGDIIAAEHDGGKAFGVVTQGMVNARKGDTTVNVLGEGDVFGEIAGVLNTNRSADLIAATSGTEVVLFSVSAIKRIKDDADRAILWQNMAQMLARKVLATTELLSPKSISKD
ncbi:MAG: cyclic nucleotide-binding domain-containing protein [Rhodothermaceae bacterium]|nr:cyclic nucleotide-binding domain-containing protein [Rhodothermaceae bacterium]